MPKVAVCAIEVGIRISLELALKRAGFEVSAVHNPSQLRSILTNEQHEVAVIAEDDYVGDLEIIPELKAKMPQLRVVALTFRDDEPYLNGVIASGADVCTPMPFELRTIVSACSGEITGAIITKRSN